MKTKASLLLLCLAIAPVNIHGNESISYLDWKPLAELPPVGEQTVSLGVAGPYVGTHNNALIVAGGANFPKPYWGEDKVWHDDIWVLEESGDWTPGGSLPRPLGYGASLSLPQGVLCIGGNDAERTYSDAFLLKWDPNTKTVQQENLPNLPTTIAYTMAAAVTNKVYVIGGTVTNDLDSAINRIWTLDIENPSDGWEEKSGWPGPERGFQVVMTQNNGYEDRIFLFSGRREKENGDLEER